MDTHELLTRIRREIESKIQEQIDRHQRVNPHADTRQIVELAKSQEQEKLLRLAEESEDEGNDTIAEAFRTLANDWLPDQTFARI